MKNFQKTFSLPIGWNAVKCPKCGFEYIHIDGVFIFGPGDDDYKITEVVEIQRIKDSGVIFDFEKQEIETKFRTREKTILVRLKCEEDHIFYFMIYFHKGQTYTQILSNHV